MDNSPKTLTSAAGAPVENNDTSKTAGPRGPVLMEDFQLFEKMAHFNRERIAERVVHAGGAGAYGTFTVTHDITRYTRANLFSRLGQQTETFVRFSLVAQSKGGSDIYRDLRGFAIKFYTEEGNWDLAGNNTPVFFVRDPMKFMDFIRSQKEHPQQNWRHDESQWDFWSNSPESLHQVTWLMGDRGAPKGFRHMNGFGSHTFSLINAANQRVWVKFHLKTNQGIANLTNDEWKALQQEEIHWSTKDLFEAIERGDNPSWTLHIQVMTEAQAESFRWNPFDLTKVWPHGEFPLIEVGQLELNRNPDNYFAHVEQAAFTPGNVVPGISWSPDRMLQARIISYADTHRYRLGVNYELLPVNSPHASKAVSYHRDGLMRSDDNGGAGVNYAPNSKGGPLPDESVQAPPYPVEGMAARYRQDAEDHYEQPRALYGLMDAAARKRLTDTIAGTLGNCVPTTQARQIALFSKVDPDLGRSIAQAILDGVG